MSETVCLTPSIFSISGRATRNAIPVTGMPLKPQNKVLAIGMRLPRYQHLGGAKDKMMAETLTYKLKHTLVHNRVSFVTHTHTHTHRHRHRYKSTGTHNYEQIGRFEFVRTQKHTGAEYSVLTKTQRLSLPLSRLLSLSLVLFLVLFFFFFLVLFVFERGRDSIVCAL